MSSWSDLQGTGEFLDHRLTAGAAVAARQYGQFGCCTNRSSNSSSSNCSPCHNCSCNCSIASRGCMSWPTIRHQHVPHFYTVPQSHMRLTSICPPVYRVPHSMCLADSVRSPPSLHIHCRNEALHVGEHDLQVFLKSLHNELDTVALHPDPSRMVGDPRSQPWQQYHRQHQRKQCPQL